MLYKHQQKYANGYKDKELVVHEGGSGKTICACVWLKDNRDDDALVICPKRVVKKWQEALAVWGTKATVVSKENFKKLEPKKWSALVVDEADEFASPLYTKQRSQLSTYLFNQVNKYDVPILLMTATPIRSNPYNLHTLLAFKGHYIEWKKWRNAFFEQVSRPYLKFPTWMPKADWRENVATVLKNHADIVNLKDITELPPLYVETIKTPPKGHFINEWIEPKKTFVERHKFEQNDKVKYIKEVGKNFRKIIVVAYYREEVERLNKELSKERETFMVHGGTKNQEDILKYANEKSEECYLVVQASLGCAWDGDTFSALVFTSMSYAVRDYVQMTYRMRRIHNMHPAHHYHLIAGKADKVVYDTIKKGKKFIPSLWNDSQE